MRNRRLLGSRLLTIWCELLCTPVRQTPNGCMWLRVHTSDVYLHELDGYHLRSAKELRISATDVHSSRLFIF